MAVELNYIAELFMASNDSNPLSSALYQFAAKDDDGIVIEFDGYHDDGQSVSGSESPDTPRSLQ